MVCSPSTLFVDYTLWAIPQLVDSLVYSYQNLSEGDPYDCGLTSVPCDSNITKAWINSDPTLVFWFDLIVVYIILTLCVVVGIFGNVINIIIFSTNTIVSDSTNNLILALSVSDLINAVCIAIVLISCFVCNIDESTGLTLFGIFFSQVAIATRWFSLLSLDFVTVIAIQRATAVVFPFKISMIFSRKKINIIIAILFMLCLSTMIPMNLSISPRWVFHPYFDKYIYLGAYFRFGKRFNADYGTFYINFRTGINLVMTVISCSLTVYMLNRHAKKRASLKADTSTSGQQTSVRETKAIKMSLAICFVTLIIYSLGITMNIVGVVSAKCMFQSPFSRMSEYIFLLVISINSTFNFFLYVNMSDKYRDGLRQRFKVNCKE